MGYFFIVCCTYIVNLSKTKTAASAAVILFVELSVALMFRWSRSTDLEQRNGRIIRQGNTFDKVNVFNYVTENTFDAYMMNIIVTKQEFISQLMSGKTPARTCEDVDEAGQIGSCERSS